MKKNIEEFLSDLAFIGVKLSIEGDRLRCLIPEDVRTSAIKQELTERKQEILAFIRSNNAPAATDERSIRPAKRQENLLLSFAQQGLWFQEKLTNVNQIFDVPNSLQLKGKLNFAAFESSIQELVRRHEILRTTFTLAEASPIQVVHSEIDISLPVVNLQELSELERETEISRLIERERTRHFDLEKGPLLRFILLQLGQEEYILLFTIHHLVTDGWSVGIIIKELAALYQAGSENKPSPLPELSIQYADYAIWQRQYLQREILENLLAYWKQKLKKNLPALQLPTDYPRPAIQTFSGQRKSFSLSADLTQALKTLSHNQNVTFFMTLLAGLKVLLSRYSGQDDVLIGSPIANRNQNNTEQLIGFFVNTLALRTDLSGDPSFCELLKRIRETTLGAYAHQDLPFELLVQELQPERNLSSTPLIQVMFILHNAPIPTLEMSGLALTPLEMTDQRNVMFDLTVHITETESGLEGSLDYNTDLFEPATIERMVGHLERLLEAVAANPQQKRSQLPLLTEPERQQLLFEWNDTERNYPQDKCIHQLFEAQVEQTPDSIAVVFEEQELTYLELNTKANQLAHYLQTLGVKPEVIVGICVERSLEMVIGLLAILKTGGTYIPLDPNYPQERTAFILEQTQASVLLTQASLRKEIPPHQAQVVCLDTDWDSIAQQNQSNLSNLVTGENLAYIIYTSGSTGKPKGVQISHKALSNFLSSMKETPGLSDDDTLLAVTTYSFDITALELFLPLIVGARLVVASQETVSDGIQLSAKLVDSEATVMQATPATWQLLFAAGWSGKPQLKVLCGGEALPATLATQLIEGCDSLWNMYGPTETTIWSAASQVKTVERTVPISDPIANTQLYILDKDERLVPIGVAGELCIGGMGLARSYFHRPDLTAEKFIPNPFSQKAGERLYRTGDLARYLPSGEIEYIGRIDYQVKVRGFRIELGEIEAVIAQHLAVRESVVVVREESTGSSDSKRLVAYVVARQDKILTITELREFLESKLPSYMIPSVWVTLESLPLTPNGKVDRKALPAPEKTRPKLDKKLIAPRNSIECKLAEIWAEVLDVEKVGVFDNFFELGGDSILAIVAIAKANETSELQLTVKQLFQHQTVAALATVAVKKTINRTQPESPTNKNKQDIDSDFPKANLNQKDLERFLAKVKTGSKK